MSAKLLFVVVALAVVFFGCSSGELDENQSCTAACAAWWVKPNRSLRDRTPVRCECVKRRGMQWLK